MLPSFREDDSRLGAAGGGDERSEDRSTRGVEEDRPEEVDGLDPLLSLVEERPLAGAGVTRAPPIPSITRRGTSELRGAEESR